MNNIDSALERNRAFAAAGGHQEVINDVAFIGQLVENA
jgi:hypothetical protein